MDDTLELRQALAASWKEILDRLADRGYPVKAALETMVSVGYETFSEIYGPNATATFLQLAAASLLDADLNDTRHLVNGDIAADGRDDTAIDLADLWQETDGPLL